MDLFGYKLLPQDSLGEVPQLVIQADFIRADLGMGTSLSRPFPAALSSKNPFTGPINTARRVSTDIFPPPAGSTSGHHLAQDDNFTALLHVDPQVPVAPMFGKDLTGRIIYLSYGPLKKLLKEWHAYQADAATTQDGETILPNLPLQAITFPRGCRSVKDAMPGEDLLENVLLTKFRLLDIADTARARASGSESFQLGIYESANLYPYKYRLDTFYTDGWKMPLIAAVYAESDGILPATARARGEKLLTDWEAKPTKTDYETWVVKQGGEAWMDELFAAGCTLIPTFEACNGYHVVGPEFELEDTWPGRAVDGLHEVIEARADSAPIGTILDVLRPGYVTQDTVVPAQVVISDGSGYVSRHDGNPLPVIPNINLPHPRASAVWGACWLPTHPLHFEPPATWGWDLMTGYFVQQSGPLWDPVHYYYACTDVIMQAVKRPLSFEDNRWLVPVPNAMRERFYPAIPMKGFDIPSPAARSRREQERRLPVGSITRYRNGQESANIGYHPLPLEFEYELDPFWSPELHPLNREHGVCPEELAIRICTVITPHVSITNYIDAIGDAAENSPWLADERLLQTPSDQVLENYPHLARYVVPDLPLDEVLAIMQPPFLADPGLELITQSVAELWDGMDAYDDIEALQPGLYDALMDAREDGLKLMRMRHAIYQSNLALYGLACWYGISPVDMLEIYQAWQRGEEIATSNGRNTLVAQGANRVTVGDPASAAAAPAPRRTAVALAPDGSEMPDLPQPTSGLPVTEN